MWIKTTSGALVDASYGCIDIRKDAKGEHRLEIWWPVGQPVVEIAHGPLEDLQKTRDIIFDALIEILGGITVKTGDSKQCKTVPDLPST